MIPVDVPPAVENAISSNGAHRLNQVDAGEPRRGNRPIRPRVPSDAERNGEWVITPGGPRRREKTQRVEPGEMLRQNPDGTFTIVPRIAPTAPEGSKIPKKPA